MNGGSGAHHASRFAGTAAAYVQFREGYPDALFASLAAAAGVDRTSRVLDIGCGPGTCALPLASHSGFVTAVDVDEGMLREGRGLADEQRINNVEWLNVEAEAIDFPDGYFALVVIASAFHWMDRPLVARRCRSMLQENGVLAVLGNPTPLMQLRERDGVGAAIAEVQERWLGRDPYLLSLDDLDRPEAVLRSGGFSDVTVTYVEHSQQWSVERYLGFLRSTSFQPHVRLGADFDTFAAEVDTAIRRVEPTGRWTVDIPIEVIVGRR